MVRYEINSLARITGSILATPTSIKSWERSKEASFFYFIGFPAYDCIIDLFKNETILILDSIAPKICSVRYLVYHLKHKRLFVLHEVYISAIETA